MLTPAESVRCASKLAPVVLWRVFIMVKDGGLIVSPVELAFQLVDSRPFTGEDNK